MAADGRLTFDTKINTKDLDKELSQLRKTIDNAVSDDAFAKLKGSFSDSIKAEIE